MSSVLPSLGLHQHSPRSPTGITSSHPPRHCCRSCCSPKCSWNRTAPLLTITRLLPMLPEKAHKAAQGLAHLPHQPQLLGLPRHPALDWLCSWDSGLIHAVAAIQKRVALSSSLHQQINTHVFLTPPRSGSAGTPACDPLSWGTALMPSSCILHCRSGGPTLACTGGYHNR